MKNSRFITVEAALEKLAEGRILIVLDSEDRENEGDFLAAAELMTPESVHFMITYGRGQVCQPVSPEVAARLNVQPLVPADELEGAACFAMPLDHRSCETGISPAERALTMRAIADPSSRPEDFLRPGHIFPLIAQGGGVLARPGHTESAVDLAAMAGLAPSGVLCEICSCDGCNMAGVPELTQLSRDHDLPIVTIDSLIEYRASRADEFEIADAARELLAESRAATQIRSPSSVSQDASHADAATLKQ